MFLIRIGFLTDPDPAFYFNADPAPDPGKNILYIGDVIKHTYVGTKDILKGWKEGLLVNLVNFLAPGYGSAFSIKIRIQQSTINADLCGSGSETLCLDPLIFFTKIPIIHIDSSLAYCIDNMLGIFHVNELLKSLRN